MAPHWKMVVASIFLLLVLTSFDMSVQDAEGLEIDPYHSSYEISQILRELTENNTGIAEYTTAQDLLGTRSIPGNRDIPILFLGDRSEERPWIMVIGAHHGDEPDSAEAVLAFTEHMINGYNENNELQRDLVDNINIAILPVVNPFGLDNNRRMDENGEDPNRDYPFEHSQVSTQSDGIPLTTAGAHAVHSLAGMYPFSIALSFHTGSQGIFYPWGAPNVGDISPDGISFGDMGKELSRSSGINMLNGPANSFSYVADLTGAFDDHLYGSAFLPGHLYSDEMQLPWSTYTATVELSDMKGIRPSTLGNTEDLWEYPIENTYTLPMGVRICYSACQLVKPSLDVDFSNENGIIGLKAAVSGISSFDNIVLSIDGTEITSQFEIIKDPLLPRFELETNVIEPDGAGYHYLQLTIEPDADWTSMAPMSEQNIGPASLLSRSRETLTWTGQVIVDDEIEPDPILNASLNLSNTFKIMEAGEPGYVSAEIEYDENLTLEEMVIVLSIDEWKEVTRIEPDEVLLDLGGYFFSTVPMAGEAQILVNLTFEEGSIIETIDIELIPSVRILSANRDREDPDIWDVMIGVQGGNGPIPLYWGVSRDDDEEWDGNDWMIPPQVEIANGYGPHIIEVDLNGFGGNTFFRVSPIIGSAYYTRQFWAMADLEPTGWFEVSDLSFEVMDDELVIGPLQLFAEYDGPEIYGPDKGLSFQIMIKQDGEEDIRKAVEWRYYSAISASDRDILRNNTVENGFDPDSIQGGYYASFPSSEVNEGAWIHVYLDGNIYHQGEPQFIIGHHQILGEIEFDEDDEDDEKDFPVTLFVFLLMVAMTILLVSYLRYRTHWKDPIPEEEPEKPIRRRPDIRRPNEYRPRPVREDTKRRKGRSAPSPPWQR